MTLPLILGIGLAGAIFLGLRMMWHDALRKPIDPEVEQSLREW